MKSGKTVFFVVRAVFIAVVAAFIAYYLVTNWEKIASLEWRMSWPAALLAALLYGLYLVGNTLAWRFLISCLGYPLPAARNAAAYLGSALARYIPGKVWPVAGRIVLFERQGVPKEASTTGIVLELVATITAAVLIILLAVPAWHVSHITEHKLPPWIFLLFLPVAMVLLYPPVLNAPVNFLLTKMGRTPIGASLRYRDTCKLVLFYVILWGLLGVAIWLFVYSLAPVKLAYYRTITGMFALAWLTGYFSFLAPAGLGVREGVFAALLSIDFPPQIAIVIAVLLRVMTTLTEVVVALVAFKLGFRREIERE